MSALELEVYKLFKVRFTEKEAVKMIEFFEAKAEEKYLQRKDVLATKQDLAEAKADIIKWMFVFWIGSTLATLGGLIAIIRFMVAT